MSLDAWHDPFKAGEGLAGVYVEISFHEGRVGGDYPDVPFTFKLRLKRALLTVAVEPPLQIDRASVLRSIPAAQAELTRYLQAKRQAESSLAGKARISPAAFHAALSGEASVNRTVTRTDEIKVVQTIPETLVTPRPGGAHEYSWAVEPSFNPTLHGQPWDPTEPRLKVQSRGVSGALDRTIRVNVKCALDDIEISELKRKSRGATDALVSAVYNDINEKAAIQHLKLLLAHADLEPGMMDNRFSDVLLADVIAAVS